MSDSRISVPIVSRIKAAIRWDNVSLLERIISEEGGIHSFNDKKYGLSDRHFLHLFSKNKFSQPNPNITHFLQENMKEFIDHIDAKDNRKKTPLHYAVEANNVSGVNLLIQAGAFVDCQDKDNHTPLYLAIKNQHESIVELLLKAKASVSLIKHLLHDAVELSLPIFKLILNASKSSDLTQCDEHYERTVLHCALRNGHHEIVQYLLDNHPEVYSIQNLDHNGYAPIHYAVAHQLRSKPPSVDEQLQEINAFLSHKTSLYCFSKHGWTPLHLAAESGREEIVSLLLKQDADPMLINLEGQTSIQIAIHYDHIHIANLMAKHSAMQKQEMDNKLARLEETNANLRKELEEIKQEFYQVKMQFTNNNRQQDNNNNQKKWSARTFS